MSASERCDEPKLEVFMLETKHGHTRFLLRDMFKGVPRVLFQSPRDKENLLIVMLELLGLQMIT